MIADGIRSIEGVLSHGGPVPVSFRSSESDARQRGDWIWQRHTSCEFKRDAVSIALISGLTRRQVASDLGFGFRGSANGSRDGSGSGISAISHRS